MRIELSEKKSDEKRREKEELKRKGATDETRMNEPLGSSFKSFGCTFGRSSFLDEKVSDGLGV